jgi:transitional endoplasmic reticulum ATPase
MIKIIYGKSSSQNYNLALKRAKRDASKFYEEKDGNTITNVAEYDFSNLKKAEKLWEIVSAWKSAELYIKGEIAEKYDLAYLKSVLICMDRHDESLIPQEYCRLGNSISDLGIYFGCKKITAVLKDYKWQEVDNLYFMQASNLWYRHSKLDKIKNKIIINKDRIKQLLVAQATKEMLNLCPYFNKEEILEMVNRLPSEINLDNNEDFIIDNNDSLFPVVRTKEELIRREEIEKENKIVINIGNEDKEEIMLPEVTNVKYEDIGGLDKEIRLIKESVEIPFKYPEIFRHLGITPYKGILFYGPPGTGKTLLAKAVANETDMNFYTINGPEIFDKYFGESEKKIREIFAAAQKNAPSVVFIDEIDSIASKRGDSSSEVYYNKIVTQLLTLMDGMEEREQVIVMAATNRPNSLDSALRRPGRLDFEIYIAPPDKEGRLEILKIHSKHMPLNNDVDLKQLAELLHGYVGADIKALCKEAALFALRRHLKDFEHDMNNLESIKVAMEDFKQAKNKIIPSAGREVLSYRPSVKWEDVIGLEEVKIELAKKIINPWLNKSKNIEIRRIKGLLLYGVSGVGKTYLSKALASEMRMNIISIKGSDILSKYHGESVGRMKHYFDKARELAPSMIIIDEIDAIATGRERNISGADLVNELLSQMDGYDELTDVLVVGTTNLIDSIDQAVLRPGRFDLKVELPYPTREATMKIFKYYLDRAPMPYDSSLLNMGLDCKTGAEIENIVLQAVYEALWSKDEVLKRSHLIISE